MDSLAANEGARRVGATLGVIGTLALAYYYILVPLLTVPSPANYGFYAAWLVLLGLSIAWWRRHPWRSLAVPIVGLIAALAADLVRVHLPGLGCVAQGGLPGATVPSHR